MPIVYTSRDATAPPLNNGQGYFTNLLKTIFTQGYAEKSAMGWTVEFEDATTNDILAVRNAGTGYFLRFAYSGSGDVTVQSYESMTDVNNGTNPSVAYLLKYYSDTEPIEWAIVGDNKSFYFYANQKLFFFGDFPSFIPGDLWNFGISTGSLNKYNILIDVIRPMTGEEAHKTVDLRGDPFGSEYFGGESNTITYPYNGNVFIAKPLLFEDFQPRGVLCGLTDFKHKKDEIISSVGVDKWATKEVEGINYIFFDMPYGLAAIDLDNWWSIQ